ncbi:glycosyltransferase family 2 protein [Xanthovirga aplysinae]|uniref:glycosyltransferase family 2 protein n=1 Tax=Xanthovirga aplysinae TaxID=2529853 RepID=UPI0012BD1A88|nr:glycosyltransferase family 2 protein [Xanthovirga aplysinae]MTI33535.1 glycosyltransferase family 2 protein [Xanthovirga aplysinae]
MQKLAIVILNYNGKDFLQKFLPSVLSNSPEGSVIVADNASTDQSVSLLKKGFPQVRLIEIKVNGGYSAGYNEALRQIEAEYYVLLNSDVEVTPNWTEPIVQFLDKNPQVAACQPKILSWNRKDEFEYAGAAGGFIDSLGYPFCRGRVFQTLEKDLHQYDDVQQIFWATGACLFIRSSIFHNLGGLDDDFFAHMEEIDLCWRINSAGYKVFYIGESTVFHVGGGTLKQGNPRKTYLNFRNGLTLLYKNLPWTKLLWKLPIRIFLDLIAALKFLLSDRSPKNAAAVLKAHKDFFTNLNTYKSGRKQALKQRVVKKDKKIYSGSIVLDYFLRRRKTFSKVNF